MKPLLFLLFLLPVVAGAQTRACDLDTVYQQLDFWVGEWSVYDGNDVLAGHNRIEKILNGCAIMEHWTGSGGGEGKSLFYVDNDMRQWRQVWVTGSAMQPWGQKEKVMVHSEPGQVLFQGSYLVNGSLVLDRTLLEKISGQEVRQTIQISRDGGQNWQTTFFGIYRRTD